MTSDTSDGSGPIIDCIANWHAHLAGEFPGGLDALLHPDCVFYSPVVFTPQRGRDITKAYLSAASVSLAGMTDDGSNAVAPSGTSTDATAGFSYRTEILQGHHAMLEFETTMFDPERERRAVVNGVDIITCDDEGLIVEFKVMLRPLQAVNLVHASMRSLLESMNPPG